MSLKNYRLIYSVLKVIKNRKNDRFINSIIQDDNIFRFQAANNTLLPPSTKAYYLISYPWNTNGFFAIMRKIAESCIVADSFGFYPLINVENSVYNVPNGYNSINNMFEYYFMPTSSLDFKDALENANCIISESIHLDKVRNILNANDTLPTYGVSEDYLHILSEMVKRYFVLKPELSKELNTEIFNLLGEKKTIAVHYRGTGWSRGLYGHPIPVKIEQCCAEVKRLLASGFEQVFLATDDLNAIEIMSSNFGSKLVFYRDVIRSKDNIEVQFSVNKRENDGYYLGREVLRDMLTLASCQALIAGLSQVSFFARIQKEALGQKFEYEKIINNGVYTKRNLNSLLYRREVDKAAKMKIEKNKSIY